jgi:hypothetical protein
MRKLLDWLLSRRRGQWFLRVLCILFLLMGGVFVWRIFERIPLSQGMEQQLRELYALEDAVAHLRVETNDSIFLASEQGAFAGVMPHWDSTAAWLENLSTTALDHDVEMGWQFDSLQTFPEGGTEVYRLPVRISASPIDRRFETFMAWLENSFTHTPLHLGMYLLEIEGDENGMTTATVQFEGFMRP